MHLPRRSTLATLIVLCLVGVPGPLAIGSHAGRGVEPGRGRVPTPLDRIFDADHGVVAGTIVVDGARSVGLPSHRRRPTAVRLGVPRPRSMPRWRAG